MMPLWRRVFAERRSILVPLVALLIIDGALVGGAVFPLKKVVASDSTAAQAARLSSAVATQRLRQMQNARTSRDRAEEELAKFYGQVLPTSQAAASSVLILEIAKLARENNLTLGPRGFDPETIKDSALERLTTKVELTGEYSNVLRFIYSVETSSAFLTIRQVQLSQATLARTQNSGQLQLALDIATYYRVPPGAGAK